MNDNFLLYGDLTVQGFEELRIDVLKIEQEINEHAILTITGVFESEDPKSSLENIALNKTIKVMKKNIPVFTGIITISTATEPRKVVHVEITALSHTFNMDIELKSKSFQDKTMAYDSVFKEIVSQYPNGNHMDKITNGKVIEKPIIQYKETDWQFLKRVASHFNTSLVPNVTGEGARFFVGLPEVDKGELLSTVYSQKANFELYKRLSPETELSPLDCIRFEVNTHQIYELGDKVTFNNIPLYVIKTVYEYENSVVHNKCILSTKKGAGKIYVPNWNISGCSIFGKVLDTARDHIKIHLEIDAEQDISTAYWYPYATMYASSGETGWYCMPEIDDTVRLYHPENEEGRAMAINSLKPHDPNEDVEILDPQHRMVDPDVKYLRTVFGKEIKFRPDGIDVIAKDGTVFLTMNDDGTVILNTEDKMSFTATNDISIKAKNINVEATEHIVIKSEKGSKVDMKKDIILTGKEIKTIDG
ncbi:MAG: hypothetical protein FWF57_02090 [Defluviitaleaceae bacterium]|nr:hypothetical protein [Defluviitaleaceae bacterium]